MTSTEILLRYNTTSQGEHDRWRFLWNGEEHICCSVTFLCASETCHQEVEVEGNIISKWHVRPINPNEILREENETGVHFVVK